jgi:hypothetical protein
VRVDFPVGEFLVLFFFGGGRGQRERGGREREGSGLRGGEEREREKQAEERKKAHEHSSLLLFPSLWALICPFLCYGQGSEVSLQRTKRGEEAGQRARNTEEHEL